MRASYVLFIEKIRKLVGMTSVQCCCFYVEIQYGNEAVLVLMHVRDFCVLGLYRV